MDFWPATFFQHQKTGKFEICSWHFPKALMVCLSFRIKQIRLCGTKPYFKTKNLMIILFDNFEVFLDLKSSFRFLSLDYIVIWLYGEKEVSVNFCVKSQERFFFLHTFYTRSFMNQGDVWEDQVLKWVLRGFTIKYNLVDDM